MLALAELQRVWPSVELPGYREHPTEHATYSHFAFDALPPIRRTLDDELLWLLDEPDSRASLAQFEDAATRPASRTNLELLLADRQIAIPHSFTSFIASDELRSHVRSCTDCYLDLGDFPVPVAGGGLLVHFLSDSQWALHWLIFAGTNGREAVVVTDAPLGFELGEDEDERETVRTFDPSRGNAGVCAETFSEFLYRFWIENEIWFKLADPDAKPEPLSDEQRRYVEHYSLG